MNFVWDDSNADIGYYRCKFLDEDVVIDEISFGDYTNEWQINNDKENGYKRPYSFEVSWCRGWSMREGFDYDKEYRSRESGGYQGNCTHTVEDIKRWCEEWIAQEHINSYTEMLSQLKAAEKRHDWFIENGYGQMDLEEGVDGQ